MQLQHKGFTLNDKSAFPTVISNRGSAANPSSHYDVELPPALGAVLMEMCSDPRSPGLPWPALIEKHFSTSIAHLYAAPDWRTGERLAHWAARSRDVERLAVTGRGAAALDAIAAGLILGAHTILAVAPGEDEHILSRTEAWSELAALFSVPGLIGHRQVILILVSEDASGRDVDVGARLVSLGGKVEYIRPRLPATTLAVALRQSGWMKAWLDALRLDAFPDLCWDITAAWRREVDLAVEVDPEDAFVRDAVLHLNGHVHNRSDHDVDLDALANDGLEIGARISSAAAPMEALLSAYVGLPKGRLAAGEKTPITLQLQASAFAEPQTTVKIGLVCRDRFWLGDFGFPESLLTSLAPDESDRPAGSFGPGPSRGRAPPRARSVTDVSPAKATRRDVIEAYRTFLGREPEGEAAIASQLSGGPDLWALLRRMTHSAEALRWHLSQAIDQIQVEHERQREVETTASPEQMTRLARHLEAVWSRFGREQPYFSVLADPAYLIERISPQALESFYATGRGEVAAFQSACDRSGVELGRGLVVEFGCRSGRVAEALATHFGAYTGVDLSAEQLSITQDRLQSQSKIDARAITVEAFLAQADRFDVFFSVLALQHCPPPLTRAWLEQALGRLKVGGVAFFQLPCLLYDYSFHTDRYLDGRIRNGPAELHALPQIEVFALLDRCGMTPLDVQLNTRIGPRGLSYTFLARKRGEAGDRRAP